MNLMTQTRMRMSRMSRMNIRRMKKVKSSPTKAPLALSGHHPATTYPCHCGEFCWMAFWLAWLVLEVDSWWFQPWSSLVVYRWRKRLEPLWWWYLWNALLVTLGMRAMHISTCIWRSWWLSVLCLEVLQVDFVPIFCLRPFYVKPSPSLCWSSVLCSSGRNPLTWKVERLKAETMDLKHQPLNHQMQTPCLFGARNSGIPLTSLNYIYIL